MDWFIHSLTHTDGTYWDYGEWWEQKGPEEGQRGEGNRGLRAPVPDSQGTCEEASSAQSDWHQGISIGK